MSNTEFDAKEFRRALSQFPTGVTVITTLDANGNPVGVTASSFNSVSLDPALVLWSIDKHAHSLSAFENAQHFAVNVLGRDQVSTSNNFASRGEDKFSNIDYSLGLGGVPVLNEFAAQFECKTWAVYEGGDHLILVGEVLQYQHNDSVEPLVFARGSYAVSNQHPEMVKPTEVNTADDDFVSNYLLYLLRASHHNFSAHLYPKLSQECGINPEEWRILANMISQPSISLETLSERVMQPVVGLRITLDHLIKKGLVVAHGCDEAEITIDGIQLAAKMRNVALDAEENLLSHLNQEQKDLLKSTLKTLINKLN